MDSEVEGEMEGVSGALGVIENEAGMEGDCVGVAVDAGVGGFDGVDGVGAGVGDEAGDAGTGVPDSDGDAGGADGVASAVLVLEGGRVDDPDAAGEGTKWCFPLRWCVAAADLPETSPTTYDIMVRANTTTSVTVTASGVREDGRCGSCIARVTRRGRGVGQQEQQGAENSSDACSVYLCAHAASTLGRRTAPRRWMVQQPTA